MGMDRGSPNIEENNENGNVQYKKALTEQQKMME